MYFHYIFIFHVIFISINKNDLYFHFYTLKNAGLNTAHAG